MNLLDYRKVIDLKPVHIATVTQDCKPNLSIASDVKVIDEERMIICVNEMINTPKNILKNPNVVITAFDENWEGVKIWGKAKYHTNGEYFEMGKNIFFQKETTSSLETNEPNGVIVVTVQELQEMK